MRILITGGSGQCGAALVNLPFEKVFYDYQPFQAESFESKFVLGDINDVTKLTAAMKGCNAVVHLAAASSLNSSWESVLENNIIGMKTTMEAARSIGVERIIFASSNHVVGMYEVENAPEIYELGKKKILSVDSEIRPDSFYGVSKAFGEQVGRYYSETGGPKFIALRIGALVQEDNPYAHAERGVLSGTWKRNSSYYTQKVNRLKSLWISKRDFVQIVDLCLFYDGPNFNIFYALSDNPRRWLDIEHTKTALGYQPEDNAEDWKSPEIL
jgi:nucleoside-diphosphate-sugar epimerase